MHSASHSLHAITFPFGATYMSMQAMSQTQPDCRIVNGDGIAWFGASREGRSRVRGKGMDDDVRLSGRVMSGGGFWLMEEGLAADGLRRGIFHVDGAMCMTLSGLTSG